MATHNKIEGNTTTLVVNTASSNNKKTKQICSIYEGNNDVKGYNWIGASHGAMSMHNIFLIQSLLFLATKEARCELRSKCKTKVYGFHPASWISNIALIAGLIVTVMLSVFGILVDLKDDQRAIGILAACTMIVIQETSMLESY